MHGNLSEKKTSNEDRQHKYKGIHNIFIDKINHFH